MARSYIRCKEWDGKDLSGLWEVTYKIDGVRALVTEKGNIGTGFSDAQREEFNSSAIVGQCIEVECMGFTPSGKFRHPRFKRVRLDKIGA